jgi:F-type H+-transporting ATPase subunit b
MLLEAEFWVALGFFVFLGLLGYLGVHRKLAKSLDDRANRIKAELDEARKLKDEAAALLADYQRKRQEAQSEAQEIIDGAKAEAERLAEEAKTKVEEFVARRTQIAEKILAQEAKGTLAADLIAKGIEDVRKKLN